MRKIVAVLPVTAAFTFALLFCYASISKALDFENFQVQLAQSPLLSAYAGFISYAVIVVELIIASLLCFKQTRLWGLYCFLGLMSAFTMYIYLILNYSDFVPCSCGGILENLGWTEHFIFNIFFVVLAVVSILMLEIQQFRSLVKPVTYSGLMIVLSCGIVVLIFLSSEHIIKKQNNFTRRYLQHPIEEDKVFDLGANSYYFAGADGEKIYLGNSTAPLIITSIDSTLNHKVELKVNVDQTDFTFRSVKAQVKPPYYYIYDGSVPILYRGKLGGINAKTISFRDAYFDQLKILDSAKFAIRTLNGKTENFTLGILNLNVNPKVTLLDNIIEKQKDGVFDSDGLLMQDLNQDQFIYTYFYRNQFLILDSSLHLLRKLRTIDTVSRAQVQVALLKNGQHKMNAPPLMVNKGMVAHSGLLFNQSNLKGKYETAEIWKEASIIDVYKTGQQEYVGSFYISNRKDGKMSDMMVTDRYLYILCGNGIVRYEFSKLFQKSFRGSRKP
ncbi:MauE/DoxX family redox-associated membrane protein [Chryseobacterium sp. SIMBA_029]|uniref:MauE/DoxX family redox-associated membrane protein n=1 Tax=Chryseobacterium sp. SIMBA_029 TaxID=3085772 RepID=UPI00397DD368